MEREKQVFALNKFATEIDFFRKTSGARKRLVVGSIVSDLDCNSHNEDAANDKQRNTRENNNNRRVNASRESLKKLNTISTPYNRQT